MTNTYDEIYAVVKRIPKGKVMSYVGVARQWGRHGAQRLVGYALFALRGENNIPWWRVINAQGRISNSSTPDAAERQRALLRAEGVVVSDDFRVKLREFDGEMAVYKKLQRAKGRSKKAKVKSQRMTMKAQQ